MIKVNKDPRFDAFFPSGMDVAILQVLRMLAGASPDAGIVASGERIAKPDAIRPSTVIPLLQHLSTRGLDYSEIVGEATWRLYNMNPQPPKVPVDPDPKFDALLSGFAVRPDMALIDQVKFRPEDADAFPEYRREPPGPALIKAVCDMFPEEDIAAETFVRVAGLERLQRAAVDDMEARLSIGAFPGFRVELIRAIVPIIDEHGAPRSPLVAVPRRTR